ncbi:hypothetical protein [Lentzea sp. NPDC092896]|uniref:caspase, EACC1-associated type n=1 Tax=Lentzea sp. NPDC092896 TaxID=3364127 RepID=UPI00380A8C44
MRLPVPDNSRVVLIGTTTYSGELAESPLESVRNNVIDLMEVLTHKEFGGFRRDHCVQVLDEPDPRRVLHVLGENADLATDVLLVYLAGHARPKDPVGNELYVCLQKTDPAERHWWLDALSFGDVRNVVRHSPAANRIIIVDTCFAGLALPDAMGEGELFQVAGAYTLTAVSENERAFAPQNARNTAFTGALTRLLTEGVPGHDDFLSLPRVFPILRNTLMAEELPQPRHHSTETVDHLAVVRNRATRPSTALPDDVRALLIDPINTVRLSAVGKLAVLHQTGDDAVRSESRAALVRLVEDDSRTVANESRRVLDDIDDKPATVPPTLSPPTPTSPAPAHRTPTPLTDLWWIASGGACGTLTGLVLLLLGCVAEQALLAGSVAAVLSYLAAVGTASSQKRNRTS